MSLTLKERMEKDLKKYTSKKLTNKRKIFLRKKTILPKAIPKHFMNRETNPINKEIIDMRMRGMDYDKIAKFLKIPLNRVENLINNFKG